MPQKNLEKSTGTFMLKYLWELSSSALERPQIKWLFTVLLMVKVGLFLRFPVQRGQQHHCPFAEDMELVEHFLRQLMAHVSCARQRMLMWLIAYTLPI